MIGQICMQNLKLHWRFTPKFGTLSRCAQYAGTQFSRPNLLGLDLSGPNLLQQHFPGAQFAGAQFAGAQIATLLKSAQFAAKSARGPICLEPLETEGSLLNCDEVTRGLVAAGT